MKNAKWKMTNDPVATARGSDTRTATLTVNSELKLSPYQIVPPAD
jgi:hypothetical protein